MATLDESLYVFLLTDIPLSELFNYTQVNESCVFDDGNIDRGIYRTDSTFQSEKHDGGRKRRRRVIDDDEEEEEEEEEKGAQCDHDDDDDDDDDDYDAGEKYEVAQLANNSTRGANNQDTAHEDDEDEIWDLDAST